MSKKHSSVPAKAAAHATTDVEPETAPHPDISSPDFDRANDRMKLASKPNDGLPLAHRDRLKGAGRKG